MKNKNSVQEGKPDYYGHRDRLREKFISAGGAALHDYELLELLLFYAIPRKDVKAIAKRLIARFGSIRKVFSAGHEELLAVEGVTVNMAALVAVGRELCGRFLEEKTLDGEIMSSPEIVANFARAKLAHLKDEVLMAVYVNSKNRVCGYDFISEGTVDCAVVYPRKIVKKAIERNASGIIISHNHPSGECEPSADDISLTRKVKDAAGTVDIRVLDHVIVGTAGHYSFVEKGMAI
jgi:DNA repair protein RadC